MSNSTTTAPRESQLSIRAVITDQTQFRLPPKQWEAFYHRLDAPPQMIPALIELFCEADPFRASDDV